jgi:hypothetical protein
VAAAPAAAQHVAVRRLVLARRRRPFRLLASGSAVYQPVLANLWPLSMMLFGIYFPDRLSFDRQHPASSGLSSPVLFRVLGTNVATDLLMLT